MQGFSAFQKQQLKSIFTPVGAFLSYFHTSIHLLACALGLNISITFSNFNDTRLVLRSACTRPGRWRQDSDRKL